MKKEDIHLGDWQRILFGNAPAEFLLEVLLRTLVIYLVLVVVMRLLGKRMNAQLTLVELAVMIMLGGIVSVAMEVPERGIAHGALILVCTLLLFRTINWLAFRYRRVELLTQGDLLIVVVEGVLDLHGMHKGRLSHAQLFAELRAKNVRQLGELKRVYLETNGRFSVYRQPQPKPGLSILPSRDATLHQTEPQAADVQACAHCGYTEPQKRYTPTACPHCGHSAWTHAVLAQQPPAA